MARAPWKYSEGGQQGATSSLIMACAAIQPHLARLDAALLPHGGSTRNGIDDGVTHAPRDVIWKALKT